METNITKSCQTPKLVNCWLQLVWLECCKQLTHTQTHTRSHTHTLSLSLLHTHTLSLSYTHTLTPTHTNTLSLSHTFTLSHPHTQTHSLSLALSHPHTHTHSHTHTHTHTLTPTHTLSHPHTQTLSHPPTHTHTHALSLSHTHARTHTHAHTHTRAHSHTHARTHTLSLSLTHTLTHTHTVENMLGGCIAFCFQFVFQSYDCYAKQMIALTYLCSSAYTNINFMLTLKYTHISKHFSSGFVTMFIKIISLKQNCTVRGTRFSGSLSLSCTDLGNDCLEYRAVSWGQWNGSRGDGPVNFARFDAAQDRGKFQFFLLAVSCARYITQACLLIPYLYFDDGGCHTRVLPEEASLRSTCTSIWSEQSLLPLLPNSCSTL
jgi:hypothetical protein